MMANINRIFTVIDDQPVYLPGELSRKILLMLDGGSLHQARQVCQGWNEAVLNLVWGQDRAAVEKKLRNNWRFAQPARIETTLRLEGFVAHRLLSFSENRAVFMMFDYVPEEEEGDPEEDQVKIVEFNTKNEEIVHASDVTQQVLDHPHPLPGDYFLPCYLAYEVEHTVVLVWRCENKNSYFRSFDRRVFAYNLKTHQISFDKVYENIGDFFGDITTNINERTKEIQLGRTILKITEDNGIEEVFVGNWNFLPNTVALHSNLCITSTPEDGAKLLRSDGNEFIEIGVLHPGERYYHYEIYPETSRIIAVSRDRELPLSVSVWNSDTGNLIQEETLPLFYDANVERLDLSNFKIEGDHLVLLFRVARDDRYQNSRIVIYDLDKVLAGEDTEPRETDLGGDIFSKMLVDKTSITVASNRGSVVKFDFWRCD